MLGRKTESDVRKLFDEHVTLVEQVLDTARQAVERYLGGELLAAKQDARKVDRLESAADAVLREIMTILHQGAFLPILRKDIFKLAYAVDKVANAGESFCDFCLSQRPDIPLNFHEAFLDITHANIEMFPLLREAVEIIKLGSFGWAGEGGSSFPELIKKISIEESSIDDLEWKLTRDIFRSDLPLANKMHLHEFLNHITIISDLIEDVADRISLMITREAL